MKKPDPPTEQPAPEAPAPRPIGFREVAHAILLDYAVGSRSGTTCVPARLLSRLFEVEIEIVAKAVERGEFGTAVGQRPDYCDIAPSDFCEWLVYKQPGFTPSPELVEWTIHVLAIEAEQRRHNGAMADLEAAARRPYSILHGREIAKEQNRLNAWAANEIAKQEATAAATVRPPWVERREEMERRRQQAGGQVE